MLDASTWASEWRYRQATLEAELGRPLPDLLGSSPTKFASLQAALEHYGPAVVEAVLEHTARLVAAGQLRDALYSRVFVGDGFNARWSAWQEHTSRASKAAASIARAESTSESFDPYDPLNALLALDEGDET